MLLARVGDVDFSAIERCRDITDEVVAEAVMTREDARALLEHAALVSRPAEAGARVLLVFAKMATPDCDWVDGALRIEIVAEGEGAAIESFAEIGGGLKERVFPVLHMKVPLAEFAMAIERFPQAIVPLAFTRAADRLVLTATEVPRPVTEKPPMAVESDPRRARIVTPNPMAHLPTVAGSKVTVGRGPTASADAGGPKFSPPQMSDELQKKLARIQLKRKTAIGTPAIPDIKEEKAPKPKLRRPGMIPREDPTPPPMQIHLPPGTPPLPDHEPENPEKKEGEPEKKDDVDKEWG